MATSPQVSQVENFLLAPQTRTWIYLVSIALIALATGYGVIAGPQVQLWTNLADAVLGIGNLGVLAIPNVPKPVAQVPNAPTINDPGMGK